MQTNPDPSSGPGAESAVGLTFVAVVLVSLFVGGALGVVATRRPAPPAAPAREPEATAVASESTTALALAEPIAARMVSEALGLCPPGKLLAGSGGRAYPESHWWGPPSGAAPWPGSCGPRSRPAAWTTRRPGVRPGGSWPPTPPGCTGSELRNGPGAGPTSFPPA